LILKAVLKTAAAVAAVSAAVAASVAAAGFALYALLEPYLGRPGAAAIVALILALVAAVAALILTRGPRRGGRGDPDPEAGMAERLIDIARTKPILSAAAAIAAGLIAWRNPALVGIVATALLKKPERPSR
jgi:hypothetical protein